MNDGPLLFFIFTLLLLLAFTINFLFFFSSNSCFLIPFFLSSLANTKAALAIRFRASLNPEYAVKPVSTRQYLN